MAIGPVPRATTPSWPRGGAAGACRRAIGARPRRCSAASATGGAAACGRGIGDTPVMATRDLKRREAGAPSPGDRRPVGADHGERSGLRLRRRRADRGPKAPCAHRQARPGRPPRRGAGPRRRARGVARHPRPSAPAAPRLRRRRPSRSEAARRRRAVDRGRQALRRRRGLRGRPAPMDRRADLRPAGTMPPAGQGPAAVRRIRESIGVRRRRRPPNPTPRKLPPCLVDFRVRRSGRRQGRSGRRPAQRPRPSRIAA